MPEFRRDIINRDWVIIAGDRDKRPDLFKKPIKATADEIKKCPFEPENWKIVPDPVWIYPDEKNLDPKRTDWLVKDVPNKFPVFTLEGSLKERHEWKYEAVDAVGHHEVIIHSPDHNANLATISQEQFQLVLKAYLERYRTLAVETKNKYVLIIVNHGESSGASLTHSHSQLFTLPHLPVNVNKELRTAKKYYEDNDACVFCDVVKYERKVGQRVVWENDDFVIITPYASRSKYETWFLPKDHNCDFSKITHKEMENLGIDLQTILKKYYYGLNNPSYNVFIHTAPTQKTEVYTPYYHWHIEIQPRLAKYAGFEYGSGIIVNSTAPESAALLLRGFPTQKK